MVNIIGGNHGGASDNTDSKYPSKCTKGVSYKGRGHKNTYSYMVSIVIIL